MSDASPQNEVTTIVYGWRLERRDGVTLGFTSHDRDVVYDGLRLQSSPGMIPTTVLESAGLEANGLEVAGSLDADAITQSDLLAGRWDYARLSIFQFDWESPGELTRMLAVGEIGEVSVSKNGFNAELRGLATKLDAPVVPQTSPGCRAAFCDAQCGLNRPRFSEELQVASAADERVNFITALSEAPEAFAYGELRWLEGPNCGLVFNIVGGVGNQIILSESPQYPVSSGERVLVFQGCDKMLATCTNRFGNAINFRGEPFLPGNDLLTRYPGAS